MNLLVFETKNDMLNYKKDSNYEFDYLIFETDNPFQIRHKLLHYNLELDNLYYRHLMDIINENHQTIQLNNWVYKNNDAAKGEIYYNKINNADLIINMCQNDLIGYFIFNFFINQPFINKINSAKLVNNNYSKKVPTLILEAEIIRDETSDDNFNDYVLTDKILNEYLIKYPYWEDFSKSEFNLFNAKTMKVSFNNILWKKICRFY